MKFLVGIFGVPFTFQFVHQISIAYTPTLVLTFDNSFYLFFFLTTCGRMMVQNSKICISFNLISSISKNSKMRKLTALGYPATFQHRFRIHGVAPGTVRTVIRVSAEILLRPQPREVVSVG